MNTRSREKILMAESVSRSLRSSSSLRDLIRNVSRLNGIAFNSANKSTCAVRNEKKNNSRVQDKWYLKRFPRYKLVWINKFLFKNTLQGRI